MSLKQFNLGSARPIQARFINYEYGPLRIHTPSLPQEPSKASQGQPLKGISLGVSTTVTRGEEKDFQIAMKRRRKRRAGASLEEIGRKYGL
jgi:hypothetical protein